MKRLTAAGRRHSTAMADRGGYLYVGIMLVATLVGIIGLTAVRVGRLHLRAAVDASASGHAASLSNSAIEHALAILQTDADWRTTYQPDVEYPAVPVAMGTGSWTWKLVDDDGSLTDDDSDFVRVVGTGRDGDATIVQSVTLYPTGVPVEVMTYPLHSHGDLSLSAGVTVSTNGSVSSNAQLAGPLSASVSGNAVASSSINVTVSGATTIAPARQMPGSSVFEYYEARGTHIPVGSLPLSGSVRVLESAVLSAASNPFGTGQPGGLYIIDCQNQTIEIRNCRIVGTLLLLNPGVSSRVTGAILWDQSVAGFPALLVDGDLLMNLTTSALDEATLSTNFNPAGTAYQEETDSDTADSYPTAINGGIYVAGDLTVSSTVTAPVTGTVIATGDILAQSSGTFQFDATSFASPPPGFAAGNPMLIVPGSQRRESLP